MRGARCNRAQHGLPFREHRSSVASNEASKPKSNEAPAQPSNQPTHKITSQTKSHPAANQLTNKPSNQTNSWDDAGSRQPILESERVPVITTGLERLLSVREAGGCH